MVVSLPRFIQIMRFQQAAYRAAAFLRHQLTAWNTGGEGIHSPYLFYFVRHCLYDQNQYYAFSHIEKQRAALLHNTKTLTITDYGTGKNNTLRQIKTIAATSLEKPGNAQILFRLVQFLSDRQWNDNKQQPLNILELGTSLGITTAYLAAPSSTNNVVTLEGSNELLQAAASVWKTLNINNIKAVCGNIDTTLSPALQSLRHLDLAYIDANHTYEATMRYWQAMMPFITRKSVIVIDDIHWSKEMQQAWLTIQKQPQVTSTFDLFNMGLVFFDPAYLHKHYKLRI